MSSPIAKRQVIRIATFVLCLVCWLTPAIGSDILDDKSGTKRPNIILILTDDQGWTSMSSAMDDNHPNACSDYHRTPHMDELASRGMRFPNGYAAAPICSPTRYSILFGKTPARLGKTIVRGPNQVDHSQLSIPQALKQIDPRYQCAHFGKWHIAVDPTDVGYDQSDGLTTNQTGGFRTGKSTEWSGYSADDPKLVDYVTQRGIDFMREQSATDRPFYLQLSHYAVHSDIVYKEATRKEVQSWPLGKKHSNRTYAAMLKDLDNAIGDFMKAYDDLGVANNTYIFFTSDNGGMASIPPKRMSGHPYQQGLNAPLRRGKWDLTEGGLRVPFFVSGPGISARTQCDAPVISYDLLPTFAELAEAKLTGKSSFDSIELDGKSFAFELGLPDSIASKRELPDSLFFHMPHYNHYGLGEPHSAIRQGDYKLISFAISNRSLLFNLKQDPGEQSDLSMAMPQRAKQMHEELNAYLKSVNAEKPKQSSTWKIGQEGKLKTKFLGDFP